MAKRLNIKIYGIVQGVSFRYYTELEAKKLGISGWVKNIDDGTVEIEAEGEEESLKEFLKWCRKGSSSARVEKLEHEYSVALDNYTDFEIRH